MLLAYVFFQKDREAGMVPSEVFEEVEILENDEQYNTMVKMIKNGDFSCLDIVDSYVEMYAYTFDTREWIVSDINKDGFGELILQEIAPIYGSLCKHRIVAVFTYQVKKMHCTLIDVNDNTEYYFLGNNGNMIYSTEDFLANGNFGEYFCCTIDEEGEVKRSYRLNIAYMNETDEIFYVKAIEPKWENMDMTREEFFAEYQEMTGFVFEDPTCAFENMNCGEKVTKVCDTICIQPEIIFTDLYG